MEIQFHVLCVLCVSQSGLSRLASGNLSRAARCYRSYNRPRKVLHKTAEICQTRGFENIATHVWQCPKGYLPIAEAFEDTENVSYSRRAVINARVLKLVDITA